MITNNEKLSMKINYSNTRIFGSRIKWFVSNVNHKTSGHIYINNNFLINLDDSEIEKELKGSVDYSENFFDKYIFENCFDELQKHIKESLYKVATVKIGL